MSESQSMMRMEHISFKKKLAYGSAALADAGSYTVFGTFLLFFLTTVADIDPVVAGAITALGSVVNMISAPIAGFVSDNIMTKTGKRIPFLKYAAAPLGIACCLMFSDFGLRGNVQIAYYIIAVMMFWISYAVFFNPYMALGAEITEDYDERTSLRAVAYLFNTLGMFVGMVMPNGVVALLQGLGVSTEKSWTLTAGLVGLLAAASIFYTAFCSPKGVIEPKDTNKKMPSLLTMIKDYREILTLKPLWPLMLSGMAFLIANSIGNSTRIYFFTYNLQCKPWQITIIFVFIPISGMVLTPMIRRISGALDKRKAFIICLFASGFALLAMRAVIGIVGTFGMWTGILFTFLYSISNTAYWQLSPAMIYDVCTLDELKNGKRREAGIMAVQCLAEALSGALGLQILGIKLRLAGFDGEALMQAPHTLDAIQNTLFIFVAAFIFLGALIAILYPINKERYEKIVEELNEKRWERKSKRESNHHK